MKRIVLTLVISLAAAACLPPPAFGTSYNPEVFTLAAKGGGGMGMTMSGNFVLWQDMMEMKWIGYDLAAREPFTITSGNAMSMTSNEFYAVWRDDMVMSWYGYDLAARRKFPLGIGDADGMSVRLTEHYLIYKGMMDMTLHGMDLKSGEMFVISSGDIDGWSLRAAGDFVAWRTMAMPAVLSGFQLSTRQGFLLSDGESIDGMGLAMSDQFVAWREGIVPSPAAGLYGFDLAMREKFLITHEDIEPMSLRAAGRYIVGRAMMGGGLYGFDGSLREIFEIASNADAMSLRINEGYAAWKDMNNMHWYGFDLPGRRLIETGIESMNAPVLSGGYLFYSFSDPGPMINELRGFDLATGLSFTVATMAAATPMAPIADGDYVVWTDMIPPSPDTGLFGARIWKLPNDLCEDAVEVTAGVAYAGDSSGAMGIVKTDCGFDDWRDTWHLFRPAVGGEYTIDARSDAFDTTLAMFEACTGNAKACNDNANLQTTNSQLVMTLTKGKRYLFRMAGYDGSGGPYELTISRGSCKTPPQADLTGDCKVNLADLAVFSSQWLRCGLDPVALCAP
jgi:hypothetical protein